MTKGTFVYNGRDYSNGGGGGSSSAINYSTEEQVIGTWIDGKPLYQITRTMITPGDADAGKLVVIPNSLIPNAECRELDGVIYDHSYKQSIPINAYQNETYYCYVIYRENMGIRAQVGAGFVSSSGGERELIITMKYTKNTD